MTGPEHYREAEKLLRSCQLTPATDREAAIYPQAEDGEINTCGNALAAAQVHATLALAAATALTGYLPHEAGTTDEIAWTRAANNGLGVQL